MSHSKVKDLPVDPICQQCQTVFDFVLSFRSSYLRDSEWPLCQTAIDALRDLLKEAQKKGIDLFSSSGSGSDSSLPADDIAFLKQVVAFQGSDDELKQLFRSLCEQYLLTKYADFLDNVEKYPLNAEQRQAVVRTNDRNLILAAAGTGKTSVIVAKALYLLKSGAAQPKDILIMAYNRAAADEIKERLNACAARAGIDGSEVNANTFHALGRSVLVRCKVPARVSSLVKDKDLDQWLDAWFYTYLKQDPNNSYDFVALFMSAILHDQILEEHTFNSEHSGRSKYSDYIDYIKASKDSKLRERDAHADLADSLVRGNKDGLAQGASEESSDYEPLLQAPPELYRTLHNEQVKSRQEAYIANWLAINGIPYTYEDDYITKVRLEPGFDYTPTFHIFRPHSSDSDNDVVQVDNTPIYLECYDFNREDVEGINVFHGDNKAAKILALRKRKLHQENGTILLEVFAPQVDKQAIDQALEEHMKSVDIPLSPCSPEVLLAQILGNKSYKELRDLLKRCLQITREFNYSYDDLLQRYQAVGLRYAKKYATFFAKLAADYKAQLDAQEEIDFCDMIIQATKLVADGRFPDSWRYILVDEFQDISSTRLKLLQQLVQRDPRCVLTCVGDDWQAIYHFVGGILDATIHFENYFGAYTLTSLVQTYRYPKSIALTAGAFVQNNPQQFKKNVVSLQQDDGIHIHMIDAVDMGAYAVSAAFCTKIRGLKYVHNAITSAVAAIHQAFEVLTGNPDATIAIISRYNKILEGIESYLNNVEKYPANKLLAAIYQFSDLKLTQKDIEAINRLKLDPEFVQAKRKQIKLWTIHKSKGLEADFVIFTGLHGGSYLTFPCPLQDDGVLGALLDKLEDFKYAEERRLFYVTLTRAKRDVYLICDTSEDLSAFAAELFNPDYKVDIQVKAYRESYLGRYGCKVCYRGIYRLKQGKYGHYYECSNRACQNHARVCEQCGDISIDKDLYSECANPECGARLPLCERCGRPMRLRESRYGKFYGCSGYGLPDDPCDFIMNYKALQSLLDKNK